MSAAEPVPCLYCGSAGAFEVDGIGPLCLDCSLARDDAPFAPVTHSCLACGKATEHDMDDDGGQLCDECFEEKPLGQRCAEDPHFLDRVYGPMTEAELAFEAKVQAMGEVVPLPVSQARNGRRLKLTPAKAIRTERVHWLEDGRFAKRGVALVGGEKGLGKSIYTNAHITAALTRGTLEGEFKGEPCDVLIVTAEDDWRSVVKPRLMACNADLDRVHRITVEDDDGEALFTLPDDVGRLELEIRRLRIGGRKVAAVVIDPIGAFLPSTTNTHADAPVRRALAPLASLADRCDIAIIVVAHLTKDEARRFIHRFTGAGAFVNAARSVLVVVRDPEDPEGEQGLRRLIVHVGSNWGRYAPTLAAHIEARLVDTDDDAKADVGYLVMDGESSVGVDDLQVRDEDASDVEDAIVTALAGGPKPSREVKTDAARELRCSRRTIERAAVRMADDGQLTITSEGFPRRTTWALAVATPPVATNAERSGVATEQTRLETGDLPSSGDSSDTPVAGTPGVATERFASWPGRYEPPGGREPEDEPDDWRNR